MKRSLAHLPSHKRAELKEIVSIIRDVVNEERMMIILFGSSARDDWVEDIYTEGHITYEYKSDYDILLVVENPALARYQNLWRKIEGRVSRSSTIKTHLSLISHDIDEVNENLSQGEYFFTDIKKEGILLYDSKHLKLARARKLSPAERKRIAQEDYDYWYTSARQFYVNYEINFAKRWYPTAAFMLHQATERFYHAILLVFTHYKPKEHNIERLGKQVINLDRRFLSVFPRTTKREERLFDLLKKAYVDARYKKTYEIGKEELEYLAKRVRKLQRLTKKICREKIESFL